MSLYQALSPRWDRPLGFSEEAWHRGALSPGPASKRSGATGSPRRAFSFGMMNRLQPVRSRSRMATAAIRAPTHQAIAARCG